MHKIQIGPQGDQCLFQNDQQDGQMKIKSNSFPKIAMKRMNKFEIGQKVNKKYDEEKDINNRKIFKYKLQILNESHLNHQLQKQNRNIYCSLLKNLINQFPNNKGHLLNKAEQIAKRLTDEIESKGLTYNVKNDTKFNLNTQISKNKNYLYRMWAMHQQEQNRYYKMKKNIQNKCQNILNIN